MPKPRCLFLFITCTLFLFSCKKDDYRVAVTGTYRGQYYHNGPGGPHWGNDTIIVEIDNSSDNLITIKSKIISDVLSVKLAKDNTISDNNFNTTGEFKNDSLLYSYDPVPLGVWPFDYYLKKQ
jgi:hypothetical protein